MTVYVILFMVPLAFYIKKSNYEYSIKLLVFLVVACLIIGLRRDTVDRDYIGYVYSYITPVKAITEYIKGSRFTNEPGIGIISSIIIKGLKLGYQWVFILFAFLGLSLKVEAFRHIAPECFFAALLIHFSNTLFLHDFTQIRVSIALGLFLFSIQDIFEKRLLLFTLKIL